MKLVKCAVAFFVVAALAGCDGKSDDQKTPGVFADGMTPAARDGQLAPPDLPLDGGDEPVVARLLGSWLPAPDSGARRNDMVTFNPDGTRTVSDGSGMSATDSWAFDNGQLTVNDNPLNLEFEGYDIVLSGSRFQRRTLNSETYTGRQRASGVDQYGMYVPASRTVRLGDYSLHYILIESPESFDALESGRSDGSYPITVEFWNTKEQLKQSESGAAYRNDVVRFEPQSYEISANKLKFYGQHPQWGELYFNGEFETTGGANSAGSKVKITGDLMVKGLIFRGVKLSSQAMH